jgi:hypothetical protein
MTRSSRKPTERRMTARSGGESFESAAKPEPGMSANYTPL